MRAHSEVIGLTLTGMAVTSVLLFMVLLGCNQIQLAYGQELSVVITVDYTPPPGFTPGLNEYRAASGLVTVTCTATGGTGYASYQWSSTCRDCPFESATSRSIRRGSVNSGDTGIHTCTATRGGIAGNASIEFNVVGAGIHVFDGNPRGPLPNNGLVISDTRDNYGYRFRFVCRSDSMLETVGKLVGLDGSTALTTNRFFYVSNTVLPHLFVLNSGHAYYAQESLPSSEQGVYTCRIPLQSGEMREINIGIYPSGFNTPPSISNLVFTTASLSSNLTCTSTGSPATMVTWSRNGQTLTIDGSTYQLTQTVTNRRESTYENVLTINDQVTNIAGHIYSCTVTNYLGSDSREHLEPGFQEVITGLEQPLMVGETATITCAFALKVTSIKWLLKDDIVREDTSGQQQLNLTFSPVNDSIHNLQYICRVTTNGTEYDYPVTVTVEVPASGAFTVFLNPHGNPTAGESYLLTCTAVEVIAGLRNMPSLQWLDSNGSPVQGTGITVGELQITDTAAILTLTFDPLRTSHAGVYTCWGMLESPAVVGNIIESTMETVLVAIPAPTLTMIRDPDTSVTLRHGDNLTMTCTIQLDPTVDSDVIVTGELSGPGGSADNVDQTLARMFQIALEIASLQATSLDTYTCTAAISPGTGVMNVRASEQSYSTLDISVELLVTITVDYTPPPGFTPGPNEYRAASGPVIVTCTAAGGTWLVSYQWSSTCRGCPFQSATLHSVRRAAAHSGDTGTHTCTVTAAAAHSGVITGNASIEFNVVGSGIHVFYGNPNGSFSNNGLVVCLNHGHGRCFRFFCRSDSVLQSVGELVGLDGSTAVSTNKFFYIINRPFTQLTVYNWYGDQDPLPSSEQGVYTCRIPLQSGEMREINIGIYPPGFNIWPNISNLVFDPPMKTLTCISTGSPATTVIWMRDGQPLTIDGSTYQLTQTVTNRRESTYENVLTVNDELNNIISHIFHCNITNALGSASEEVRTLDLPSVIKIEFDPMVQSLTCTVSATTVTWMKDGQPLTIDGSTYHTVTNRITSVESTNINENVLKLNEPQSNIVGHTYTCVASSRGINGISSQDIDIVLPPVEKIAAAVVNVTAVNVSWTALELLGWDVSHYTLYYTAFSIRQKRVIDEFSRMLPGNTTSVVLQPVTRSERIQHEFHVSANVGMYEGPWSEKASVVFDKEFFQLQIGPVGHCVTWQPEKAKNIEAAIQNAVADAISYQCKCTFPREFIRSGRFSCRNVTTEAIYRSTVIGTMSHNASQLVNFIQNWVNSRPTVEVEWWLMDVYADCPVRILSLVDPECRVSRSFSSDQTLVTTDPAIIQCVTSCLHRQKGDVCQV